MKDFLNKLVGLNAVKARSMVVDKGFDCIVMPPNAVCLTAEALHNTVVVWQNAYGKVIVAQLGDRLG